MIVRRGFHITHVTLYIWPLLTGLLAYDVFVTVAYMVLGWQWLAIKDLPLPLLGSAIVLVVTLRNNLAYGRWWEARTLWGAVVNNSRSLARGLLVMTDDPSLRIRLVRHQIAYVASLRCHLLRQPCPDLDRYLPETVLEPARAAANVPNAIQAAIAREIGVIRRTGAIDAVGAASLDRTLSELANAQGGLERIKNTPLPRQYNQFPQLFIRIYCLLLPIGLVQDLEYLTPIGSTVIGFMFLALDRIGQDLEDPFENQPHDVPMAAIARTIEIDLLQTMGDGPAPEPLAAKDGVLW